MTLNKIKKTYSLDFYNFIKLHYDKNIRTLEKQEVDKLFNLFNYAYELGLDTQKKLDEKEINRLKELCPKEHNNYYRLIQNNDMPGYLQYYKTTKGETVVKSNYITEEEFKKYILSKSVN